MQTEVLPSLVDHAERLNISTFLDVSTPASPVIELADAQDNGDRTHSLVFFPSAKALEPDAVTSCENRVTRHKPLNYW